MLLDLVTKDFSAVQYYGPVPKSPLPVVGVAGLVVLFTSHSMAALFVGRCLILDRFGSAIAAVSKALRAYSFSSSAAFELAMTSCFHMTYYSSRPLHNVFGAILSMHGWGHFVSYVRRPSHECAVKAITWCSLVAAFIRVDQAPSTLAICAVIFLISGLAPFRAAASHCLVLGVVGVALDTVYWWGTPHHVLPVVMPELQSVLFNLRGSSEWGTSAWWWYGAKMLDMLDPISLASLVLSLPQLSRDFLSVPNRLWLGLPLPISVVLLFVPLTSIAVMSFLPHKEARFVFPQLIQLVSIAAITRPVIAWPLVLLGLAKTALKVVCSVFAYPGGWAVAALLGAEGRSYFRIHRWVIRVLAALNLIQWKDWAYLELQPAAPPKLAVLSRDAAATGGIRFLLEGIPYVIESPLCDPKTLMEGTAPNFLFESPDLWAACGDADWVLGPCAPPNFIQVADVPVFDGLDFISLTIKLKSAVKLYVKRTSASAREPQIRPDARGFNPSATDQQLPT